MGIGAGSFTGGVLCQSIILLFRVLRLNVSNAVERDFGRETACIPLRIFQEFDPVNKEAFDILVPWMTSVHNLLAHSIPYAPPDSRNTPQSPPVTIRAFINKSKSNSRGRGGRICFFAEAWKATTCDTFLFTKGDRKADRQECLERRDWRAIEAIVSIY